MSLTSLELNYLIWRYLQESGYELAAYSLQKNSNCLEYEHEKNKLVPTIEPGTLVNLVQKGILYTFVDDIMDGKGERLSLVNALIKDKKEREENNNNTANRFVLKAEAEENGADVEMEEAEATPEPEEEIEFTTAAIDSVGSFPSSLTAQWHPEEELFVYGSENSTAVVCALEHGSLSETVTLNHLPVMSQIPGQNDISTVSWAPLGEMVLTSGASGEIRVWSAEGRLKNIVNSPSSTKSPTTLQLLLWSLRGHFVLSVDASSTVSIWDGTNLTLLQEIRSPESTLGIEACWLSDLKFAVSTSKNVIRIYSVDPDGVVPVSLIAGHSHPICLMQFSPVSKLLASASDRDHAIKVWNNLSPQDALELNVTSEKDPNIQYHNSPIVGLHWVSRPGDVQGNELLSVSMDGTVNLWDAFTGDALVTTNIFKNTDSYRFGDDLEVESANPLVFATALSPDSRYLAVGDAAGNVSVWDARSRGKTLRCLGMYAYKGDTAEVGICDLVWDSKGKHICVCYKGTGSVVLKWN